MSFQNFNIPNQAENLFVDDSGMNSIMSIDLDDVCDCSQSSNDEMSLPYLDLSCVNP